MKKLLIASIFTITLGAVPACQTLNEHSAAVQLIVSQAAMRYIETAAPTARAERAAKIIEVVAKVRTVASGEPVTIADLARLAISEIPSSLAPSDRALAVSIVNIAAQELQLKIGEGTIPADALVKVTAVLDAVRDAASIYVAH